MRSIEEIGRILALQFDLPSTPSFRKHPQFGRNAIYLALVNHEVRWFIKAQAPSACGEAAIAQAVAPLDLNQPPVLLLPAEGLAVYPYIDPLATLEDMARAEPKSALVALVMLARKCVQLETISPPAGLPIRRSLISFPLPALEQVLDISPATQVLIQRIQASGLAPRLDTAPGPEPVFSHGDIKLDNIIMVGGQPRLIDWEAACWSAPGSDCAALAAIALQAVIRADPSRPETAVPFEPGFAAAALIARTYLDRQSRSGVSSQRFAQLVATQLIHRAVNEAMHKRELSERDQLLIDLAADITANGIVDR